MVTSLVPFAIFVGAAVSAALAFYSFWDSLRQGALERFGKVSVDLDSAGLRIKKEEMLITCVTIAAALWIIALLVFKPPILVGLLLLPAAVGVSALTYLTSMRMRMRARVEAFLNQFETVLRLMASGLRSGLGLQQALNLVIEETADPVRYEFARVIGQTNIGASVYDALDDLATRVHASETLMMARVVRINSQTGGDLARVLEQLGNTIKERRRMRRKVQSLTAEGRAGAWVLGALPILLGFFVVLTQPEMSHGLLYTPTGHIVLLIIAVLETLGIVTLNRILKVNV